MRSVFLIQKECMTEQKSKKTENATEQHNDSGDLLVELKKMNRSLKAQTSFGQTFVRGVVSGFGSVIGATIVVGLVIGFVAWILVALVQVPILGDFVKDPGITQQINRLQ